MSTPVQLDVVFDTVDDMLLRGEFDRVNYRLSDIEVWAEEVDLLLTWLTVTSAAKDKLNNRAKFYRRVWWRLLITRPFTFKKLLYGLE